MPSHSLNNFEIQIYYQNEPKYNDVYSRSNLNKIKDGAYVINLDEYPSIETHYMWMVVIELHLTMQSTLEKLKNSYATKISKQIFIEYKHTIQ